LLGLGLILIGLGIGISVVLEAWALYKTPERIERFAIAIEQGSQIDKVFRSVASQAVDEADSASGLAPAGSSAAPGATVSGEPARASSAGFRLSYFAAWAIVLALMLVVGTLAMSAAATGAKLALPNTADAGGQRRR
jgi:hypothetical protein